MGVAVGVALNGEEGFVSIAATSSTGVFLATPSDSAAEKDVSSSNGS